MSTTMLRKQRISRALAAGAALVLAGSLAACGSKAETPGSSDQSKDSAGTEQPAGDVKGEIKILVSSAAASDKAFEDVVAAFNAKYPEAKATLESVPNDVYPTTKSARLKADDLDIFVVKNMKDVPDYATDATPEDVVLAQDGDLVDLTNEPFMKNYIPSILDAQAIGGKQFAIPTGTSFLNGVYYNKTIFKDAGVEVPTTWKDLQDAVTKIEGAGKVAFGIGGKDTWPAGLVMNGVAASLYPTQADKQAAIDGLWKNDGSVKLDDGKQLEVLQKTQYVFEHTQPHFSGSGYDDMPAAFARGEFAMLPDGTWNNPTIFSAVDKAFEVGFFPLPASDNATDNKYLNGKIELQLGANAATKNKATVLAFLDFFSQPENYTKFVETSGFASVMPDVNPSEFLKSIADYTSQFEMAWEPLWIPNPNAGDAATFPFNYPALAPLGSDTAEVAAKASADAWTKAF